MHVIFSLLFVLASFLPFHLGDAHSELGSGADPLGNTLDEEPPGDYGPGADPHG